MNIWPGPGEKMWSLQGRDADKSLLWQPAVDRDDSDRRGQRLWLRTRDERNMEG